MVRFENLADIFDVPADYNLMVNTIDVDQFARQFYQDQNNGGAPTSYEVEEVSLSANQPQSELDKRSFRWIGEDDETYLKLDINQIQQDDGPRKILQP